MASLAGKSAFITAAGQGIGRATAVAFATAGAKVIATDVDAAKLSDLQSDLIRTRALDVLDAADQWAAEPATVEDALDAQDWARDQARRAVAREVVPTR